VSVQLDMGGVAEEAPQPVAAKLQPAWMQRDGVISRGHSQIVLCCCRSARLLLSVTPMNSNLHLIYTLFLEAFAKIVK
jgi:hypothetical protein